MGKLGKPKQHVPIFVGSTYEDLKEYRAAVRDALHQLETIVRGMEYFGSKPGRPKEECLKAVQSCKAYIGIFAMRYGSIDEESGKSMTHLEYEEGSRLELPMLIYLIDEQNQPVLPKDVETGDKAKLLQALKRELKKNYTVSFYTTPDDLAKRVAQDLPPILEQIGVGADPIRKVIARQLKKKPEHLTDEDLASVSRLDLRGLEIADLTPLQRVSGLRSLDLRDMELSDLTPLQGLSSLRYLELEGTQVSDLRPLQGLSSLRGLDLRGTWVSDLTPLRELSTLRQLRLRDTQVSDLSPLHGLTSLQHLGVRRTQVSEAQIQALKKVLPDCYILWP